MINTNSVINNVFSDIAQIATLGMNNPSEDVFHNIEERFYSIRKKLEEQEFLKNIETDSIKRSKYTSRKIVFYISHNLSMDSGAWLLSYFEGKKQKVSVKEIEDGISSTKDVLSDIILIPVKSLGDAVRFSSRNSKEIQPLPKFLYVSDRAAIAKEKQFASHVVRDANDI